VNDFRDKLTAYITNICIETANVGFTESSVSKAGPSYKNLQFTPKTVNTRVQ